MSDASVDCQKAVEAEKANVRERLLEIYIRSHTSERIAVLNEVISGLGYDESSFSRCMVCRAR